MTNNIPKFVLHNSRTGTSRKFKSLKRKQLKAVKDALDNYQGGCYHSPAYKHFEILSDALYKAIEAQSIKNWGN